MFQSKNVFFVTIVKLAFALSLCRFEHLDRRHCITMDHAIQSIFDR